MRRIRPAAAALSILLLTACGSGRQTEPQVGPIPAGLRIRVENESGSSLRVYARVGSSELPLGRVEGGQGRTLRLPLGVTGHMNLIARPAAGRSSGHVSEPFNLNPGQWMTWRLRDSPGASDVPRLSTVQVFNCQTSANC